MIRMLKETQVAAEQSNSRTINALSLDGGGIRGLVIIMVLNMSSEYPLKNVNMYDKRHLRF